MSDPINNNLPISPASELARQVTRDTRESERHNEARSEQKQVEQQVTEQVDQFIHQERPRPSAPKEPIRRPADYLENTRHETVSQNRESQRIQNSAQQVVKTPPARQASSSFVSSSLVSPSQRVTAQPEVPAGQASSNQSHPDQGGQGQQAQTTATALAQDFARLTRGVPQTRSQIPVITTSVAPRPLPTASTTTSSTMPRKPLFAPQTPRTPATRTASSGESPRTSPGGRTQSLKGQVLQTATTPEVATNPAPEGISETPQGREPGVYDFALAERGHYTQVSPEQVRDNLTAALRFQQMQRGTPVPIPSPVATQQQLGETLSARLRNTRQNSERTSEGKNKSESGRVNNRDLALGVRRQFRGTAC